MWRETSLLLLLLRLEAAVASQCWQGATFSEAVVSPAVDSSGILRVPGAGTLPQCVAACCELPGYELAWLFEGRCYVLSCQRGDDCRPRQRRGADSVLAFLRRASPQTLVLQSLVRGEPYGGRWGPLSRSSEAPGDLEALKDLGMLDAEYSEESQEEKTRSETEEPPLRVGDNLNQSEAGGGAERNIAVTRNLKVAKVLEHTTGILNITEVHEHTTAPTMPAAVSTAESEMGGSSRGPVAVVGPDRVVFLPVGSVTLDGSGSSGSSFLWEAESAPPGVQLQDADRAVAMATGLRAGRYVFRLTVSDQQGVTDSATIIIKVQEVRTPPPVAHASGSHTLTLPNNSLVLRGSVSDGDQDLVHYLWTRDRQSPAAGDVLYGSESQAWLYLANLVEGTYLFQLRVSDARGRSSTATATVEVRPEPGGGQQVELEMLVSVSQVSLAQRDTVVRQLAALLHVLDSDVQVRALQGHSHLSTVLRFSVRGPSGPLSSSLLVNVLRKQLLREKSDYLLFRVLRVDTVLCLLHCSGRGQCDPISKQCTCDPFWTENLIRRYLGDGESNCEWRVLYVILSSFVMVVFILSLGWTFICCCKRRRQAKGRRKTKYTILDNMDEQEKVELRPKFSIKHRSTEHNSCLMMSESELDSDQDGVFSRDRPPPRSKSRAAQAARNGNAFG
ncbi:dyslexia-associated protein KIAA0319 homolog [Salarias fasciatus]|uniref:dyslexia-associated protein KIAA0319 homolog n=1 Tax=Salarias fasciatus TaxID=181472 RepID=UPI001176B6E0|nr:dyslexia-associated protein KIAA0319 homolog [Salarias fasciatus]